MKKYRHLLEAVCFLAVFCLIYSKCYEAVKYKNLINGGGMENFYENDVPIDVYVFGTSHASCTINNAILWDEYGIPSYILSSGEQSTDATYYFMQEAFRYNKPKVVLIETLNFPNGDQGLASLYRSALTTKWSFNYPSYILHHAKAQGFTRQLTQELLLRMPIVHSRYNELEINDFVNRQPYGRGYEGSNEVQAIEPAQVNDERKELAQENLYYLDKIIELCEKEQVTPIFFHAPYSATYDAMSCQNSLKDYITERGYRFIDFATDNELYGIDYNSDFRESSHLNNQGAAKVTRALGDLMVEEYGVASRAGEAGYEKWDIHSRYLADKDIEYSLEGADGASDYLKRVLDLKDEFDIVISFNGNYTALGDDIYMDFIDGMGITYEEYQNGGVWYIKHGEKTYSSGGASAFQYHDYLENHQDLNLYKAEEDEFPTIRVKYDDYTPSCNGISIVIYDHVCDSVVDSAYVDVYEGTEVKHLEIGR